LQHFYGAAATLTLERDGVGAMVTTFVAAAGPGDVLEGADVTTSAVL